MLTNGGYIREMVERRDQGVCQVCGLDTKTCPSRRKPEERRAWLLANGYAAWHSTALWEADHIVAVIDGGADLGLANIQTLCAPCHREKTAQLAARRAEERKAAKAGARQARMFEPEGGD